MRIGTKCPEEGVSSKFYIYKHFGFMKKLFAGIAVIASVAMAGCSQKEMLSFDNENEKFVGTIVLQDTRTSLGTGGATVWSDDDAVSIFKRSGYHQMYQVEAGGSNTATLVYAGESVAHNTGLINYNYAVYPYSAGNSIDANEVVSLDLSSLSEQLYAEGTFENGKAAMVAKSADNSLSFFNTLAVLRVKLCAAVAGDVKVSKITLTSKTQALNGMATVNMATTKQPAIFTSAAEENKSTALTCETPVELTNTCDGISGGHDFYILMPAVSFPANDLTIKVDGVDVNGNAIVYEAEYQSALSLERSGITTIHHQFEASDWTADIEPVVIIDTADEFLEAMNNSNNIAVIELAGDIDLSQLTTLTRATVSNWNPIGTEDAPFNSVLDGKGYKIKNLQLAGVEYAALIAYAGGNAQVKNLTLENVDITSSKYAAGVVCTVVEGGSLKVDGVNVSGTIVSDSYAAGIVFDASNVQITNCRNDADITSNRAGGIAAWISNANMDNVVNNGNITAVYGAAGISNRYSGTISNAVNNGMVISESTEPAAGIICIQLGAVIYDHCFNYGAVISKNDNPNASAAGILGQTPGSKATLSYCANYGSVTAEQSYAAGIAYSLYGQINASYCYNAGNVNGAYGSGAIAPKAQYGTGDKATFCLNAGTITSSNGTVYQGSNNNVDCYYYNGADLLNVTGNVAADTDAVLAKLNGGTDNGFFTLSEGKITVIAQ